MVWQKNSYVARRARRQSDNGYKFDAHGRTESRT